jgi:Tim10/DDP family zinc finger
MRVILQGEKRKAMVNQMAAKLMYMCWDKCITGSIGKSFSNSEVSCQWT